ncbi:cytochrome c biogenesis CcdA family protein [Mycolicibacterium sp.]|uniref:cytochrome c biogenesis CcdA family protein n=1 Tax=Mycolicibacterium sp. TaxID=2320850 RepID=UPI001A3543C4|nr:cytochrome c biogenesis CcdA family protein [Mycolicibacterium sp.]MBJ7399079.1 cytochrome c biogenesis protein CcdA [Mycolicibacterium sp.]
MDQNLVGLAFVAGMVAAFNPCGFAMLPAYLTLVIDPQGSSQLTAVSRALAATAAMALGFLAVFGSFGLLTVSVASTVQRYLPYVTLAIGVALVGLGIWFVSGREIRMPNMVGNSGRWAPTARLGSMFGYGVGYAIASLSCTIGPFLAVTGSSLRKGSPAQGVLVYLAYAAGIALVVGVLAVAVALASSSLVDRMRTVLPYINRISGLILVVVGLYVGYYGFYEIRLFTANGSADDPVISGAGRLQRVLAGWVYQHGGWPWLLVLGALIAAAGAMWTRRRRRRTPR